MENKGQILDQYNNQNNTIKFLLYTNGMNVQLKANSFSYDTYQQDTTPLFLKKEDIRNSLGKQLKSTKTYKFHRIDITLEGANEFPQIIPEDISEIISNYIGNDNQNLQVRSYGRIKYIGIYAGIDLVFTQQDVNGRKGFEYYFIVHPGADPSKIRLRYSGVETSLDQNKIELKLEKYSIKESIPYSFITTNKNIKINELSQEQEVSVRYRKIKTNVYGFSVPSFDKRKTLVIDPTPDLVWGTYFSGNDVTAGYHISMSPDGGLLLAGITFSLNIATIGAYQTTYGGNVDGIIVKFKIFGNPEWITYYGGSDGDNLASICCDLNGNIYVSGSTFSDNNIASPNSFQNKRYNQSLHGLIAKFSSTGNRIWGTYYGGEGIDHLESIKVDKEGIIYVAGYTGSLTGMASAGSFQPGAGSNVYNQESTNGILACFDTDGKQKWGTFYGNYNFERFYDMALDKNANIYVTGITKSSGFSTSNSFQSTLNGDSDAWLVKFGNDGKRIWSTYFGGPGVEYGNSVCVDNDNNIIIGGVTRSSEGISTSGVWQSIFTPNGSDEIFIAKFNEFGTRIWGTYYGGTGGDVCYAVATDINNNVIFGGLTNSANNITTADSYQTTFPQSDYRYHTAFLAKLDNSGNRLWGTYYGSGGFNSGLVHAIVVSDNNDIFMGGYTGATDSITSCNAYQKNSNGKGNSFVAMFRESDSQIGPLIKISVNQNFPTCIGVPLTFSAEVFNGGSNPIYQWKVNGINVGTNSTTFTSNKLSQEDKVSCFVVSNSECLTNLSATSNIITVDLLSAVIPKIFISSDMTNSICDGTTVTFTANITGGGSNPLYQWQINGVDVGSSTSTFSSKLLKDGDLVRCILTNNYSCNSITSAVSDPIKISVTQTVLPSINIVASASTICQNDEILFSATAINGGSNVNYLWKVNDNFVGTGQSFTSKNLKNNDSIKCFMTPEVNLCGTGDLPSNTIVVSVNSLPEFIIQPAANVTIFKGDTIRFSIFTNEALNYQWTPKINISNEFIGNPEVWPQTNQLYKVTATASNGCSSEKEVKVTVLTSLIIPNVFSPNNDGINDRWEIKGINIYPNYRLSVFGRNGQILYEAYNSEFSWDGSYKKQPLPIGTYYYILDLKNGVPPLSGSVTILR